MSTNTSVNEKMTALADEIRELSGTTDKLGLDAMATNVSDANDEIAEQTDLLSQIANALEGKASGSGGIELPTLSTPASASDILKGKQAINSAGEVITGNIETRSVDNLFVNGANITTTAGYYPKDVYQSVTKTTLATPSISVDSSGLITSMVQQQTSGYIAASYKQNTKQLTTQAAKTITPTTSSQTAVAKNVYTTGVITVNPIPSDYIVTEEITAQDSLISQIQTALQGKASGGSNNGAATCTINVVDSSGLMDTVYIEVVAINDLGHFEYMEFMNNGSGTLSIVNVLANSVMSIYYDPALVTINVENLVQTDGSSGEYFVTPTSGVATINILEVK